MRVDAVNVTPKPVPPPPVTEYVLTLSEQEAMELRAIMGEFNSNAELGTLTADVFWKLSNAGCGRNALGNQNTSGYNDIRSRVKCWINAEARRIVGL